MSSTEPILSLDSFVTFGDLLKYLRRRARLTQRELSIAVGYSEAQVSRLEKNLRPPDLATLMALFIPALYVDDEPEIVTRLMELAAQARGEEIPHNGAITFARSVRQEVLENVRMVEENVLNNLPLQLTSFVGREHEITEIKNMLGKARLVTLTGSGGCGKTRLALEIARRLVESYREGIWFVELASITDPNLVLQAVTSTLGILESHDAKSTSALTNHLRTKQILLILDNCEQVITGAAGLAEEILRTCPQLQILVTSREILNVIGEAQFRVPALALSKEKSSGNDPSSPAEAVQLFFERAQAVLPSFVLTEEIIPAVTQICQLVDGMPLGIELAAAKISALSVGQIATRLHDSFQVLGGSRTILPHHQTLEATIQWSYDLLSEAERTLMQRLAVFSGGWTLEAAEAVASDPALIPTEKVLGLLSQLVNKSLVIVEWQAKAEARYTMLQTIHEFACGKLRASGEMEHMRAHHFDYFFTLAQQAESRLFEAESSVDWAEAEIDNLRATLTWTLEKDGSGILSEERTGRGLELMIYVWPLWLSRGYSLEGNEWLNQLLSAHTAATPARARALLLAGDLAGLGGDYSKQRAFIEESLALSTQLGDKKRIAWALMEMGLINRDHRYPEAVQFLTESIAIFQELNDDLWVCRTSYVLAEAHTTNGALGSARALWEQGLSLCRKENDKWQIAWGLEGLGHIERLERNFEQAARHYIESLKLKVIVMDKAGIIYSLEAFALLATEQHQFKRAAVLWGAAEKIRQDLNLPADPLREKRLAAPMATARTQLGDESFSEARMSGRTMKMQQAIDYALTTMIPD